MTTHVIIERNDGSIALLGNNFDRLAIFNSEAEAREHLDALEPHVAELLEVVTLKRYSEARNVLASSNTWLNNQLEQARHRVTHLTDAITEHLDAVSGAMDVEEFIAEHEDLAEAIGYEFTEEVDFVIEVHVTGKKSRALDLQDALFEVNVDTMYGEIEDIDVICINVQ